MYKQNKQTDSSVSTGFRGIPMHLSERGSRTGMASKLQGADLFKNAAKGALTHSR